MATSTGTIDIYKVSMGDRLIFSKISVVNDVVYTAGNTVTYYVDTDIKYQEEVDADETVLSPKTFTPTKSGCEFVGWRQDTVASEDVLDCQIMGDDPIILYAVFRQAVTVTYYNGNTTKQTSTGYKYYNNGNTLNPTFTITQSILSDWIPCGWSTSAAGNGGISYNNISNTEISTDITLYGMYQLTVTVTYYNGNTTKQTTSGIRYYNSGSGLIVNPTFTIAQADLAGWTARGWSKATTGNGPISYDSLSNTEIASSVTLYGMYYQTITLTLYNGSATASKPTGTRYYNSGANTYVNPTFTVAATSISGWTFRGWSTSSAGNGVISYSALSNTEFAANATLYGLYQVGITLSYNGNGNTSGSTATQSGIRYYSSAGTYVNPTFTVAANSFVKSGYSFVRWRLNNTSGTAYSPNSTISLSANATLYAEWTYVGNPVTYSSINGFSWGFYGNNVDKIVVEKNQINGISGDEERPIDTTAWTNIPNNGNQTLKISFSGSTSSPIKVMVNGTTKNVNAGSSETFNVTGLSTVGIQITFSNYSGNCFVQISSISLY